MSMRIVEPEILHQRYTVQAGWTRQLRQTLLQNLPIQPGCRLLDVGCGSGVVAAETLDLHPDVHITGLDIDPAILRVAEHEFHPPQLSWSAGDAYALPFQNGVFDGAFCHFLLLWLQTPAAALREMMRTLKPGGWLAAFAEPDYGGRIDHPAPPGSVARLQTEALQAQGADPFQGRRLRQAFTESGLQEVRCGALSGEWAAAYDELAFRSEWDTLRRDLAGVLSPRELDAAEAQDRVAWEAGTRILFVPTFYAIGFLPGA